MSKELTYKDIVKLRKQMQENNRNFYEQPIVITYQQAIQIENECFALEQENEKFKKAIKNEIELLIERRFNAYACDNYETHNILNTIIEELREVLDNE